MQINPSNENSRLTAYTDVSNYTSSNKYTCPSDGYIVCGANGTSSSINAKISSSDESNTMDFYLPKIFPTLCIFPVYVKRGMKFYIDNKAGTIYARFYPLV